MDKEPYENNEHVKFVFYNGESPVLCRGLLMLEIDGEIHTFGEKSYYPQAEFDDFWISGGDCDTEGNYWTDDWIIDVAALPEQYRKYADEICYVFNKNVKHGCCGGCTRVN